MHYYQHNIGDYRRDTNFLTLLEHGVYRQLIDQYYLNETPLPINLDKIFRLIMAKTEEEKNATTSVLSDFFTKTEDGYVHKRCQNTIQEYQTSAEKRTNAALKANMVRWGVRNASESHPKRIPTNNHKRNNSSTNNQVYTEDFNTFWEMYPNKVAKGKAFESWKKIKPSLDKCITALTWQKKSDQWTRDNGKYIPNPATWLNQNRWDDEPKEYLVNF